MRSNNNNQNHNYISVEETYMAIEKKVFDGFDNSRFKITNRLGKWVNQHTPWLSLKLDGSDTHALVAAQAYADSVKRERPALSNDLTATVKAAKRRHERDAKLGTSIVSGSGGSNLNVKK